MTLLKIECGAFVESYREWTTQYSEKKIFQCTD